MLLNILQCTGRPPAENEPAPHVSSADGKETQSQQRAQRLWSRGGKTLAFPLVSELSE